MTVSDEIPKSGPYECNGIQTVWDYDFTLPEGDVDSTHLNVYVTDSDGTRTRITDNYSVNTATKSVTYPVPGPILALSTGNLIEIRLEEPQSNTYDPTIGQWNSSDLKSQLDKTIRLIQQVDVKLDDSSGSSSGGSVLSVNSKVGIVTLSTSDIPDSSSKRYVADSEKSAWNSKQDNIGFTPENIANKNQHNGYCPLDSTGKVPSENLPASSGSVNSVNSKTGTVTLTTADISDSTDKRYVTDAQKTVIGNTTNTNSGDETTSTIKSKLGITTLSGSNTGDQSLAGLVTTSTTVNSKSLSSNITLTTSDITDSADKRYCTDSQKTVIGNTTGANTGDETTSTIKTKLGITTLSGSNTGDQDLSSLVSNTRTVNSKSLNANITLTTADIADATDKRYVTDTQLAAIGSSGSSTGTISAAVTGFGSVPSTGQLEAAIVVPYSCTINSWKTNSDYATTTGSIVWDVKRSGASIIGTGNKPTLSTQQSNSAAVSGWTSTALSAGDVLYFNIDSSAVLKYSLLEILVTRT